MIPSLTAPVAAPKQIAPQTIRPPERERAPAIDEKDKPTGPPPSFEESYLARQAREALEPAELVPESENTATAKPPLEALAETSVAEIRAISAEPSQSLLDKRS